MKVGAANLAVVVCGVVLGGVVGKVGADKLALGDLILEPVESHIDFFGAVLFDTFVGDDGGGVVVSSDSCGRPRMARLGKGCTEAGGILDVMEQGSNFGFGDGVHDVLEDRGDRVNGVIVGGGVDRGAPGTCLVAWACWRGRSGLPLGCDPWPPTYRRCCCGCGGPCSLQ